MSGGFGNEMERLERAVQVLLEWQSSGEAVSREALVKAHPDLRDLLEPMLASEREPDVEGQALGDFRLLREIGRGGMGVVYEARQEGLERRVALKVLPAHLTLHPKSVARFKREALTAARLEHEGIVQILSVGEDQDVHYFAMEFIDGLSLDLLLARIRVRESRPARATDVADHLVAELQRIRTGDRAVGTQSKTSSTEGSSRRWSRGFVMAIADIGLQVADALAHAHAVGVIHRDVKPSNVMVREDGTVVLTDFGLARETGLPSMTLTGEFAGTPYYVSPEQARGQTRDLTPATDVFSLGALLYECLTLERPFSGRSSQDVMERIQRRDPVPAHRLNPDVHPDLSAIVQKCLEKEPKRRYADAGELAEDLRAFATFRPVRARRVSAVSRATRWARREPVIAGLMATVFFTLLGALLTSLVFLGQAQEAQAEAETNLADYRRLSDLLRLQALEAQLDEEVLPPHPSRVQLYDQWREDVDEVLERRGLHQRQLADLQRRGEPLPAEAVEFPRQQELEQARGVQEMLQATEISEDSPDAEERRQILERRTEFVREQIARLEAERARYRAYRFEDLEDQWLYDNLARLVRKFAEFAEPGGLLESVRRRWYETGLVDIPFTKIDRGDPWAETLAAIADPDGPYSGLRIPEQVGLVPLGPDPVTGLQEFVHRASGRSILRDEQGGLKLGQDAGIVLVLVPGGRFTMGARLPRKPGATGPNIDPKARGNEQPVHEVELEPFFIGKYEVTQGQWLRLADAIPSRLGAGTVAFGHFTTWRHPVESVSWFDCERVLRRAGLDLPTEAQWEYAARAGTTTCNFLGDDPRLLEGYVNFADRSTIQEGIRGGELRAIRWLDDGWPLHSPVGTFSANPFGLHDVLGNVYEWTADAHVPYGVPPRAGDGRRPGMTVENRVLRGGAYDSPEATLRIAWRDADAPVNASPDVGVRAARPVER